MVLRLVVVFLFLLASCRPAPNEESVLNKLDTTLPAQPSIEDVASALQEYAFTAKKPGADDAVYKFMTCMVTDNQGFSTQIRNQMQLAKGFFGDGLGGDVCFVGDVAKACGRETLRLTLSSSPAGEWLLHYLGYETTQEIIIKASQKAADFIAKYGPEMANVAIALSNKSVEELSQDFYRGYSKFYIISSAAMANGMKALANAPCSEIRDGVNRAMGFVSYEVLSVGLLAVITAEAGGIGGAVKFTEAISKLKRIKSTPAIEKAVAELIKGFEEILKAYSARKFSKYAHLADMQKAEQVLGRTKFTAQQIDVIHAAHNIGRGPVGAYSSAEISEKYRLLRQVFSENEARILMQEGVCGMPIGTMAEYFRTPLGKELRGVAKDTSKNYQGQKVFKVSEKSKKFPDFKPGDCFYLDGLHKDHFEVFKPDGSVRTVLNLDGSVNEKKLLSAISAGRKFSGCK